MSRKYISIHSDFYDELRNLETSKRDGLLLALIAWASDGEIPTLDPICSMLFRLMTAQIERVSETMSSIGKQGGAPKGNANASKQPKQPKVEKQPKQPTITKTITKTNTIKDKSIVPSGHPATESAAARNAFTPPSVEEVKEYCRQRENNIDAEHFVDYYTARGWVLSNGKKMVDWKAAVGTWEKKDFNNTNMPREPSAKPKAKNRFQNFTQRERNYAELEAMEQVYLREKLAKG
jgi:hypothetical protein